MDTFSPLPPETQRSTNAPHPSGPVGNLYPIKILGQGAQGKVYYCKDATGTPYVAKVPLRSHGDIETSAEHLANLWLGNGSVAPRYYGIRNFDCNASGESVTRAQIYEYIPQARTLNAAIANIRDLVTSGKISADDYRTWINILVRDMVSAVADIAEKHWAHRDIKPQNFIVNGDGRLVMIDFGLAARTDDDVAGKKAGERRPSDVGTRGYIPPEIFASGRCPSMEDISIGEHRSAHDVFSLGQTISFLASELKKVGPLPDESRPPASSINTYFPLPNVKFDPCGFGHMTSLLSAASNFSSTASDEQRNRAEKLMEDIRDLFRTLGCGDETVRAFSSMLSPHIKHRGKISEIKKDSFFSEDVRVPDAISSALKDQGDDETLGATPPNRSTQYLHYYSQELDSAVPVTSDGDAR